MDWVGGFITGVVFTLAVVVGTITVVKSKNPKPIDVYRGKTTLQITYRDSIPIDSVVVFKNK